MDTMELGQECVRSANGLPRKQIEHSWLQATHSLEQHKQKQQQQQQSEIAQTNKHNIHKKTKVQNKSKQNAHKINAQQRNNTFNNNNTPTTQKSQHDSNELYSQTTTKQTLKTNANVDKTTEHNKN